VRGLILVFDREYNLIDLAFEQLSSDYVQEVGSLIKAPHQLLSKEVTIKEPGYVYIYVSNEGSIAQEVYFDDFEISHKKSLVIQSDDYYPFGLTFNSYRREDNVLNRIKFQGQEHIDELNLGWDSFKWRNHQPDIGRFFGIDPFSEKYVYNSPYAFSENDVVAAIELEGLEKVRVTNYSRIQSQELKKRVEAKNRVLNTPVTPLDTRSSKIDQINKNNNEINRIITYGSDNGFPDNYMVTKLEESGVEVPKSVKDGEQTTVVEIIDPNAKPSMELNGVSEGKNGTLIIEPIGEVAPDKEVGKVNLETTKAVGLKFLESLIEWLLTKDAPIEMPSIVTPTEQQQWQ
jgi:RHS repeat-associated protein